LPCLLVVCASMLCTSQGWSVPAPPPAFLYPLNEEFSEIAQEKNNGADGVYISNTGKRLGLPFRREFQGTNPIANLQNVQPPWTLTEELEHVLLGDGTASSNAQFISSTRASVTATLCLESLIHGRSNKVSPGSEISL